MFFSSTVTPGLPQRNRTSVFPAVKPHAPANVKAVSHSSGVLEVTWQAPPLPADGLQCQFQYHSPSTVSPRPKWKVSLSHSLATTRCDWMLGVVGFTNQLFKIASKYKFGMNYISIMIWYWMIVRTLLLLASCETPRIKYAKWNISLNDTGCSDITSACVSLMRSNCSPLIEKFSWKLDKCSHLKICSKYQKYNHFLSFHKIRRLDRVSRCVLRRANIFY